MEQMQNLDAKDWHPDSSLPWVSSDASPSNDRCWSCSDNPDAL